MAQYWKIINSKGDVVPKNEVDVEMCAYFGVEVHKRNYYMLWPDAIVYPFLFGGEGNEGWQGVKNWYDEDADDRATYDLDILPIINWFKAVGYTPARSSYSEARYLNKVTEVAELIFQEHTEVITSHSKVHEACNALVSSTSLDSEVVFFEVAKELARIGKKRSLEEKAKLSKEVDCALN